MPRLCSCSSSAPLCPELTGTLAREHPGVGADGPSGTDGPTEAATACSSTDGDRGRTARGDRLSGVRSAGIVRACDHNNKNNNLTS